MQMNRAFRNLTRVFGRSPFVKWGKFGAIILATVLATVLLSVGCMQPPLPLRIGTNVWPGYEPLYLARDLGYYGSTPIKFLESTFIQEHSRMFLNGNLEMLSTTLDAAFELAASEPETRIFALLDVSDGADALMAQPQIQTLKELKGQAVGVQNATLGKLVLARALEKAGLSEADIRVVSLDIPDQEAAFKAKQVEAVVTFEPVRSKLAAAGAQSLFDSSQMPGEIVDVLVGRAELINSHPNQVRDLLKGWYRALDYTRQHPADAAQRMAQREGVTAAQFIDSSKGLRFVSLEENLAFFQQENSPFFDGMNRLADFLRQKQILSQVADPAKLLEARPIRQMPIRPVQ